MSTHANALAGQHELETLQKSLRKSEMEIAELTKQLHAKEAEHTAEMEAFSEVYSSLLPEHIISGQY